MSLDNVLAVAAAARSNIWLLIFGLALSIPIVIAGSRFILFLMPKMPPWFTLVPAYRAGRRQK